VLQLIMDSLRYWVQDMHVDGFRFDLAATLARQFHEVDRLSAFFDLVQQDPVVSQVKLIAEPWDLGDGGYQVGAFPALWTEWNGKYRDTVRDFWRGEHAALPEFASRLTGSADLYESSGRRPFASVNFVTAHDGFTLRDLVSYDDKHNEANGEDNQDGESHNRSWNCGAEGDTDEKDVLILRSRQQRNLLTTLMLSQGVPMLLHGDELGRTQQGNNNAYCQDSHLTWINWDDADLDQDLLEFTGRLTALRQAHPVFRRRRYGVGVDPTGMGDGAELTWWRPDGKAMSGDDWTNGYARSLGLLWHGDAIREVDERGEAIVDDDFLVLLNAHDAPVTYELPSTAGEWSVVISTDTESDEPGRTVTERVELRDRHVLILRSTRE
jgi:glycogen operon protein